MANPHDQHFTDDALALQLTRSLVDRIDPQRTRRYLEPACGTGAFVHALTACNVPRCQIQTVDIDPQFNPDIVSDFLTVTPAFISSLVVIGNPPFGRSGALARKFINHAARFAPWVCMIAPRSMYAAHNCGNLDPRLDLIYEREVPVGAFSDTNTRCNWQEWFLLPEGQGIRPVDLPVDTLGLYTLVTKDDKYDIVIQRCGVTAGTVTICNGTGEGKYYIATRHPDVLEAFKNLGKHPLALQAAQQPTLSARLLHELFVHAFVTLWSRKLRIDP